MNHYVYIITNKLSNKKYIGKRSCRCNIENDKYMGSSKKLKKDIEENGLCNFKKQIIEVLNNEEEAFEREEFYITKYMKNYKYKMYNVSFGGYGGKVGNNAKRIKKGRNLRNASVTVSIDLSLKIEEKARKNNKSINLTMNEIIEESLNNKIYEDFLKEIEFYCRYNDIEKAELIEQMLKAYSKTYKR